MHIDSTLQQALCIRWWGKSPKKATFHFTGWLCSQIPARKRL